MFGVLQGEVSALCPLGVACVRPFGLTWLCLWSVDLCVVLGGGEDVREVAKMYIVYI